MESRYWLAAGWLILHFLWVGGAIGLAASAGRLLLRSTNAKCRYAFAVACILALATAPVVLAAVLLPEFSANSANERGGAATAPVSTPVDRLPGKPFPSPMNETVGEATVPQATEAGAAANRGGESESTTLARIALYLPWVWIIGAPCTFLLVATGLVGSWRLRQHSILIQHGDLAERCRRLGSALGIVRHVGVGICERLAGPILLGIMRPLILLPPAALTGWSVAQLEMVLVHELAHVRRWDSLVNLVQRVVEALLFFHPVVWWVSAWIRLERESCCDDVVVAHTGKPAAYARTLAALAIPTLPMSPVLAMAENNLVTRIRRILNLEDRSMKVSPKVLSLIAALVFGAGVILGLYAREGEPKTAGPEGEKAASGSIREGTQDDGNQAKVEETQAQKPESPPTEVRPQRKTLHTTTRVLAQVEAIEQVKLYPKVTGYVEKVHVKMGDRVKKGQALAELSVPELEADVARKKAGVVQAQAQVEQAERSSRTAKITWNSVMAQVPVAQAAIKAAQADYQFKSKELERYIKLADQNAIDKSLLDEGVAKVETARANLAAAEGKLKAAEAATVEMEARLEQSRADVDVARAGLEVAQADLQRALKMVEFSVIRSPIDGLVSQQSAVGGGLAQPPNRTSEWPLFVVVRVDSVRVIADLPEDVIALVTKGTKASARISQWEFKTKIARLGGVLDPATRTVRAELELPNPDEKLKPGMYAEVSVEVERANVWTLPAACVQDSYPTPYCYRIENGHAVRTRLKLGPRWQELVEVRQFLAKDPAPGETAVWQDFTGNERILANPPGDLNDGDKIPLPARK
jgi:multidrug efflux pump subunit AcrA (membrane-fusion protein)